MKQFILCLLVLLTGQVTLAQDSHFSQFYQSPLYLNPGFTGVTSQQRVTFNTRIQWPSLPQAFSTYAASYDIWVNELRSGFGILATTDRLGSAGWNTSTVGLLYSYKLKLGDEFIISPGVYFGYGINGLDQTKLRLGDALEYGGITLDPSAQGLGNRQYFDFAAGLLLYTKKYWLGASFQHVNTPNVSVMSITTRLPIKVSVHGGARLTVNNPLGSKSTASYLTPSFIFLSQGLITQLLLGINYHIDPVYVGAWYRGKPYESSYGALNQDAVIFMLGLYLNNFTIGYSYDFSISNLSTTSGGAHEASIVYEFAAGNLIRREKKANKLIPCPTFGRKSNFWK